MMMELVARSLLLLSWLSLAGIAVVGQTAFTASSSVNSTQNQTQPNAMIGDIMLTPAPNFEDGTRRVSVYYRTSKGTPEFGWSEICADNPGSYQEPIAKVICQQYGRKDGSFVSLPRDRDQRSRVWLYNVSCGNAPKPPYHILRCQYNVSEDTQNDDQCSNTVAVKCSDEILANYQKGYLGQVYLCPAYDFYSLNRSVSTGLVLLYLMDSWRTITLKSQSDTSDFLDTLCRQLGFTEAVTNTGTSIRSSPFSFDYCYRLSQTMPYAYAEMSWLSTDQVNCRGSSKACCGCCFDYPSDHCTSTTNCDQNDDLVISCTFNSLKSKPPEEGTPDLCSFKTDSVGKPLTSPACGNQRKEIPQQTFEITVGVLGPFALLGVILTVCVICCCCVVCYRRRHNPERAPLIPNQPQGDDAGN